MGQVLLQAMSGDMFHHEVGVRPILEIGEDLRDGGMLERDNLLDGFQEVCAGGLRGLLLWCSKVVRKHLNQDGAVKGFMIGGKVKVIRSILGEGLLQGVAPVGQGDGCGFYGLVGVWLRHSSVQSIMAVSARA